jgi:hypothetical protein
MCPATKFAGTSPVSGSITANSSPPKRAAVSIFLQEQCEFTSGAFGSLNLGVKDFYEVSVIGQARQRVLGRLLPQMILQLALLSDIFNDNLVTGLLALSVAWRPLSRTFSGVPSFRFQSISRRTPPSSPSFPGEYPSKRSRLEASQRISLAW